MLRQVWQSSVSRALFWSVLLCPDFVGCLGFGKHCRGQCSVQGLCAELQHPSTTFNVSCCSYLSAPVLCLLQIFDFLLWAILRLFSCTRFFLFFTLLYQALDQIHETNHDKERGVGSVEPLQRKEPTTSFWKGASCHHMISAAFPLLLFFFFSSFRGGHSQSNPLILCILFFHTNQHHILFYWNSQSPYNYHSSSLCARPKSGLSSFISYNLMPESLYSAALSPLFSLTPTFLQLVHILQRTSKLSHHPSRTCAPSWFPSLHFVLCFFFF